MEKLTRKIAKCDECLCRCVLVFMDSDPLKPDKCPWVMSTAEPKWRMSKD